MIYALSERRVITEQMIDCFNHLRFDKRILYSFGR